MKKIYLAKRCLQLFLPALLIVAGFFNPQIVFAKKIWGGIAEQTVNGIIRDAATGKGLSGASIEVKGSSQRTSSDANGAFSIMVPDNNAVLVITYVGYVTQE